MRRAIVAVVSIVIAVAAACAMSCTRIVELDEFPDASTAVPDGASTTGSDAGSDAPSGDGGVAIPDGVIGDAFVPDAP